MRQRRSGPLPSTFETLAGALSGLLLACSSATPVAPATPASGRGAAALASPLRASPALRPLTPRVAADAIAVDFRHPDREKALADLLPRLGERIDAFFAAEKPPSVAVAFVADGEVRLRRVLGWADVVRQVPPTSRTLYRIGSITKTFTTALVLSLRDEGKLELDAPAEQYWPELAGLEYPFADGARITLRHLLTHTSGLPRVGNFDYTTPDSKVTDAVLLGAVAEARLDNPPGTEYAYSNFGMSLLGFFAGRLASEGSLRAALAQRVTRPLGLASTTFDPASLPGAASAPGAAPAASAAPLPAAPLPAALVSGAAIATGYASTTPLSSAPLWNLGASEAAGGLWSNLDDMARWVAFQLSAWPPRPGPELGPLRRATLREQHTTAFAIDLDASLVDAKVAATTHGIGLGWHTRKSCELERLVEHGGAIDGFKTTVAFAPERGFGVVVLANSAGAPVTKLQDEIVGLAAAALPARERKPSPMLTAALQAFGASLASCPQSAYESLFDRGFRRAISPDKYSAVCAGVARKNGRCELGETLKMQGGDIGEFLLRCERGQLWARAHVHLEDGQPRFGGLRVRSTGFPATAAQARAAEAALTLIDRWDERGAAEAFTTPAVRDAVRAGFASIKNDWGLCKLAPDALTGPHGDGERATRLPIRCERGARSLEIAVDGSGKLTSILVKEPEGAASSCG